MSTEQTGGSCRLFLSTIPPATLSLFCAWQEVESYKETEAEEIIYLPLVLYRFRWQIIPMSALFASDFDKKIVLLLHRILFQET